MIIKPADIRAEQPAVGNKIKPYYDEVGNKCYDLVKRILINPETNAGRMEKITRQIDEQGNYACILKECATGPLFKHDLVDPMLSLENFNYVTSEIHNGEYIQSGGYCQFPGYNNIDSYVEYGQNDFSIVCQISLKDPEYKKRVNSVIDFTSFTYQNIKAEVSRFENIYQLPYTDTIGFLNAFFSTWTFSYPIECIVNIDCIRKLYNIPKIKYLPGITESEMKYIYIHLIQEVSLLSEYLYRITEKERRRIKLMVFLHPFGVVTRLRDIDMAQEDKFIEYNPTQAQAFIKNIKTDGIKYISSEPLGIMLDGLNKEAVVNALDCCDIFLNEGDNDDW
jgi:hypothetical protein